MRNTDEQLREIMKRADKINERKEIHRHILTGALAVCACLLLLIGACISLPNLKISTQEQTIRQYGSLLLETSQIGYVVIGALAFALGICVTILCIRCKELHHGEKH